MTTVCSGDLTKLLFSLIGSHTVKDRRISFSVWQIFFICYSRAFDEYLTFKPLVAPDELYPDSVLVVQNTRRKLVVQNNCRKLVVQNTHRKSVVQNTCSKLVVQNTCRKLIVQNTHRKLVAQNAHKKFVVQNTRRKSLVQNTRRKSVVQNTRRKSVVQNTRRKSVVQNTRRKSPVQVILEWLIIFGRIQRRSKLFCNYNTGDLSTLLSILKFFVRIWSLCQYFPSDNWTSLNNHFYFQNTGSLPIVLSKYWPSLDIHIVLSRLSNTCLTG